MQDIEIHPSYIGVSRESRREKLLEELESAIETEEDERTIKELMELMIIIIISKALTTRTI